MPSRVAARKREEGDQMWEWGGGSGGGQIEEIDFLCATAWSLQPCAPPGLGAWGPGCSEQDGVWEVGRHRNGGQR